MVVMHGKGTSATVEVVCGVLVVYEGIYTALLPFLSLFSFSFFHIYSHYSLFPKTVTFLLNSSNLTLQLGSSQTFSCIQPFLHLCLILLRVPAPSFFRF
ncbi:hypothetical protein RIF29_15851 [Crotalaria pallida]|uniref:Uncharacterized protein n=1 Tax=Crotalaria pallida TaxID=3830 RepID=A0AAN9FLC2_CROPI